MAKFNVLSQSFFPPESVQLEMSSLARTLTTTRNAVAEVGAGTVYHILKRRKLPKMGKHSIMGKKKHRPKAEALRRS